MQTHTEQSGRALIHHTFLSAYYTGDTDGKEDAIMRLSCCMCKVFHVLLMSKWVHQGSLVSFLNYLMRKIILFPKYFFFHTMLRSNTRKEINLSFECFFSSLLTKTMSDLITVSKLVNIVHNFFSFLFFSKTSLFFQILILFCLSLKVENDHEYFGLGM